MCPVGSADPAEYALAPYLDPATAPAGEGLLLPNFVVVAESDSSGFPIKVVARVARSCWCAGTARQDTAAGGV